MSHDYDTIIVGGGPAGSTAAAVLAERGRRVLVLEREAFPRYCVGESMLPYCYFPLERIGVLDALKDSTFSVNKHSVQFVTMDGRISAPFYFFQHLDHEAAQTWQVRRSEFDTMLLDNARRKGAVVRERTSARRLIVEDEVVRGVETEDEDGTTRPWRAAMTLDCSGRDGFAINRQDWRIRDAVLSKVAMWTYYRGAMRDEGLDEGATTVAYVPEKGWFWYIPLPDDTVSVGITADHEYLYRDGKDLERIFDAQIEQNAWIRDHLAPGRRVEKIRVTGDYSYRSRYCAADGLLLAGDAFAFLDPVFSSGLFLALRSGEMAGDAIDAALSRDDVSATAFADYGRELCAGMEAMRKLVYAFYDRTFSFGKLLKKHPDLRGDLTDCLIGNLFRDFDPLFDAVAQFADVPTPLAHGKPKERVVLPRS
ncbi:MAG: alkylhalidase [Phycisphaeraceae bacterium]|nr:alkylhalidase [Phycisphaeraceae bacterium]